MGIIKYASQSANDPKSSVSLVNIIITALLKGRIYFLPDTNDFLYLADLLASPGILRCLCCSRNTNCIGSRPLRTQTRSDRRSPFRWNLMFIHTRSHQCSFAVGYRQRAIRPRSSWRRPPGKHPDVLLAGFILVAVF